MKGRVCAQDQTRRGYGVAQELCPFVFVHKFSLLKSGVGEARRQAVLPNRHQFRALPHAIEGFLPFDQFDFEQAA